MVALTDLQNTVHFVFSSRLFRPATTRIFALLHNITASQIPSALGDLELAGSIFDYLFGHVMQARINN